MYDWLFDDLRREAEGACYRYGFTPEGQVLAVRYLWSRDMIQRREARIAEQREWMKTLARRDAE